MLIQPAHRLHTSRLLLGLALVALPLSGCGGASGTPATSNPPTGNATDGAPQTPPEAPALPVADTLSGVPATLEANYNSELELRGGIFEAPVLCEFIRSDGSSIGPTRLGDVFDGGRAVRVTSPFFPDLEASEACVLELRDAAGRVVQSANAVQIRVHETDVRSIDGSGNNLLDAGLGAAGSALRLDVPLAYGDLVSTPAGAARVSARAVSNAVCAQSEDLPEPSGATDLFWVWGQFLDHDIDLTTEGEEPFDILVPFGDPVFDPFETGAATLSMNRSTALEGTGTDLSSPRRHANAITSFLDGSNVYGSDTNRAAALRTLDGTGRLILTTDGLLPKNTDGLANAPTAFDTSMFVAGDVRANENIALTALHTIFAREHNRQADQLLDANPHLTGDEIYAAARAWVAAEMQVITYREFLPMLLGPDGLAPYGGYRASVDPSIGVLFSTAAYRFGHTMVSGMLYRLDLDGDEIQNGHISLVDAFFHPALIETTADLDPILRGIAAKPAQRLDAQIVDELRNFLFGAPGSPGLDLASLNLQRGRDHGLPDYNTCRMQFGLDEKLQVSAITSDAEQASRLEAAYADLSDMDVWVCALSEEPVQGALVGELLWTVFKDQFERLRDGDRFWYERIYAGPALEELEGTRLADVIRRNSGVGQELAADPFRVDGDSPALPPRDRPTPGRPPQDVGGMLQNPFSR